MTSRHKRSCQTFLLVDKFKRAQQMHGPCYDNFLRIIVDSNMAGEIIRKGDKTSHDGVVLEGSMADICMGQPIAYIGHKVHCPKCKGDFPIVEGVMTATFYGKGVALAGMKTSCGSVLIASQFTDTVDWPSGSAGGGRASAGAVVDASAIASAAAMVAPPGTMHDAAQKAIFDEQFILIDEEGEAVSDMPITVRLLSGELQRGITDSEGRTGRYVTDGSQPIEVHLGHLQV